MEDRAVRLILSGVPLAEVERRTGLSRWQVAMAARRARGRAMSLKQARRIAAGESAPEVNRVDLRSREFRGVPTCPECRKPMRICRC